MGSFLDKAKELGERAVEVTADAVEIGTLKAKIAARKSDMNKQYQVLGELLYENRAMFDLNPEEDAAALSQQLAQLREGMTDACSEIGRLKEEMAALEQDIETAKTTSRF
jgi:peptidoglycan hydrolase CwlO-like protein